MNNRIDVNKMLNILYLEDSKSDFELIQELLNDSEFFKFQMKQAEGKEDYESLLTGEKYDIILADFNLPGYDAFTALEKAQETCPEVPFIVVSGSIGEETAIQFIKKGAIDYVLKDKPEKLPLAIKRALNEVNEREVRLQAEEALIKSEVKYRTLTENLPDVITRFDKSLKHIYVNQAIFKLTGIAPESFIGKTNEELGMPAENVALWNQKINDVFETTKQCSFEFDFKTSEGIHYFLSLLVPEFNDTGQVHTVLTVARDITERKKAEINLKKTEAFLRTVLSNAPITIFTINKEGNFTLSEGKGLERVGLKPGENVGESAFGLYSQLQFKESNGKITTGEEIIKRVLKGETINAFDELNGVYFDNYIGPIRDENENIEGIVGVATDITERKKAEDALFESQEKYRLLYNSSLDAILLTSPDGSIYSANPSACRIFGRTEEEICTLGRSIADLSDPRLKLALEEREKTGKFSGELTFLRKNGEKFPAEVTSSIFTDNQGNKRTSMIVRDITERKKTEKQLIKAKNKAEESDRLKSAFLANMSHEIRTPMNGILGFAGLLNEPGLTGSQQSEYITMIQKSGERMLNIINDIISISKIESGIIELYPTVFGLHDQIRFIFESLRPDVEKKKLNYINSVPFLGSEISVFTDMEKFNSILINLLKNAIKFTDVGTVEIGYQLKEDFYEFFVKDTGIGIPRERQNAIFERFIQADIVDRMARQGAGLGLSIAKAYVEVLGGKIWLESEPGKGSVFYFTLPVHFLSEKKKTELPKVSEKLEYTARNQKKLKILIVEDDQVSEQLLFITLRNFASEIIRAYTGLEAVKVCRDNPDIDLVLMDILLPGMNGYEATRQIREFNKEVIIIAQTAFGLAGDREKALDAGCNDYISKPIIQLDLHKLIEKYFGH